MTTTTATAVVAADRGEAVQQLRRRRLAAGLSQQRLATLSDCSISSVAFLERGLVPERSAVLDRILAVLDGQAEAA